MVDRFIETYLRLSLFDVGSRLGECLQKRVFVLVVLMVTPLLWSLSALCSSDANTSLRYML